MVLDKRNLYRFPWSMNDNPLAWLEVTDICNIQCEGCYRQRLTGHKPLDQIKEEILFFKQWRNPDTISIAGGEPLLHPQLPEVIAFIAANGMKPMLVTNAVTLTPQLLRELKKAGLAGLTIHIDSRQNRPGWEGKTEAELNELRQHYADMAAAERGICLYFNVTVFSPTLPEVPDVVRWAQANIDRVHGLAFITFRSAISDAGGASKHACPAADIDKLTYARQHSDEAFISGPDVYRIIKSNFPEYEASAYLGGTVRHTSFKWLIGVAIGSKGRMYGSLGKSALELCQIAHHFFRGTYLVYLSKANIGRRALLLSLFDGHVRRAAWKWFREVLRRPWRVFTSVYIQGIGIIQAPDILSDGRVDMCENCPDMTFHEGKLVNSCRLDEYRLFGGFVFGGEG